MLENVGEVDLEFFMAVEDDGAISTYETVATVRWMLTLACPLQRCPGRDHD